MYFCRCTTTEEIDYFVQSNLSIVEILHFTTDSKRAECTETVSLIVITSFAQLLKQSFLNLFLNIQKNQQSLRISTRTKLSLLFRLSGLETYLKTLVQRFKMHSSVYLFVIGDCVSARIFWAGNGSCGI